MDCCGCKPEQPFSRSRLRDLDALHLQPCERPYVESPIDFAFSKDGGKTFSTPQLIGGNVLYSQGSRPVVGPDGTVYVFWDGATRLATLGSI
jgi:hypothetical protein